MADRLETDLIVEAISKGFKNVQRDLEKLDEGGRKAGRGMDELNRAGEKQQGVMDKLRANWQNIAVGIGAAYGAIQTIKRGWEFGKEGAQIEKVRDTFDALTASIGETSETVLTDLRAATQGMVADTELMSSSSRFLSMGLAETGDQASELSRIAVTLGSAMGKDATAAMEEFALLLSNQSIPRLDTFGISAGKVRTRIKELRDENKGMTRETAFMTAVMEEAQISMERFGDEVPVDEFAQFEVQLKNVTDEAKVLTARGLGPVIGVFNDLVSESQILRETLVLLEGDEERQIELLGKLYDATSDQTRINRTLVELNDLLERGIEGTNEQLIAWAQAADAANQRSEEMNDYWREYPGLVEEASRVNSEFNDKIIATSNFMSEAEQATRQFQSTYQDTTQANVQDGERFRAKVAEIKAEILGIPAAGDEAAAAWGRAAFEIWQEANEAKREIEAINAELDELDGKNVESTIKITTIREERIRRTVETGGGLGVLGERQHGGPVTGGRPYIVGEAGPELFVPPTSGQIIPNNQISNFNNQGATYNIRTTMNERQLDEFFKRRGIVANARVRTLT